VATETKTDGPVARLKTEAGSLVEALTNRAASSLMQKVEGATGRLADYVEGDAGPGLIAAVTGAKNMAEGKGPLRSMLGAGFAGAKEKVAGLFGGGKGKTGGIQKLKVTNIVESIDVGVPVQVAYNQWTQFRDFPTFTKKVENVDQAEETKLHWKAQVFWSHREWEADILEQRPDELSVWRSKGQKGHVDGAVTFHELTPNLTRIVLVLEYHPQGLFEHTGNLWRAQGRRARLELKHYQRHVMSHVLLDPDEVEGWRGVIEDGEVVKDHETAVEEQERERGDEPANRAPEDEAGREATGQSRDVEADQSGEAGAADDAGRRGAVASRARRAAPADRPGRDSGRVRTSRSGDSGD
jgi:uncharacterized membrane protein